MAQVATIDSTELLPPNPSPDQDQDQESQINDDKESPTTSTATINTERCTGEFVYTRAEILQLFKPYPLPKGFVQLNHITSKEPLLPLAFAPTQEHPDDTGQSKFSSSAKHRQGRGRGRGDVLRSSWSPGLDYIKSSNPAARTSEGNREVYGNLSSSLRSGEDNNGEGSSSLSSSVDHLFAQQQQLQVEEEWEYKDNVGQVQGPFSSSQMNDWFREGYFPKDIPVRSSFDKEFLPLSVRLLTNANPFENRQKQQQQQGYSFLSLSQSLEYDGKNVVISSLSNSIDPEELSSSLQDEASNQNSIVNLLLRASLRASQEQAPTSSSPAQPEAVSAPKPDVQEPSGNEWLEQLFEKAEKARTTSSASSSQTPAETAHTWKPVKEGLWNVEQVEALAGGTPSELTLSSNWLVNSTSENGTFFHPPASTTNTLTQNPFQALPQNVVWSSLSCSSDDLFPAPPSPSIPTAFNASEMFPASYPIEQHGNWNYNPNYQQHGQSNYSRADKGQYRGRGRGGGFRGGRGRGGGYRGYYQKH